jgi:hypothetical protein
MGHVDQTRPFLFLPTIFYGLGTSSAWTHYSAFLVLAATLVCMFLLASAALPDEVPAEGTDLRQYYQENGGYFWSLFSLFVLLMIAVELVAEWPGSPGTSSS